MSEEEQNKQKETEEQEEQKKQKKDNKGRFVSSDGINKAMLEEIKEENAALRAQLEKTTTLILERETAERAKEAEEKLKIKRAELAAIDPRLAKKYEKETDTKVLEIAIDTAKSFNDNFAEYVDEKADKPKIPLTYKDLLDMDTK